MNSRPGGDDAPSREGLARESFDVLSRHARSFRWAVFFLPAGARRDAAILYAFCRAVDDAVDEACSPSAAAESLLQLRADLTSTHPSSPLTEAVREVAFRRGFGLQPLLDLFEGMRTDLGPVRVESRAELELYCYRVAGTVGLMMTRILGATDVSAERYAVSLGIAMQLTNVCRDVLEDAHRDRLYLPQSELEGLVSEQVLSAIVAQGTPLAVVESVRQAVRTLLAQAEGLYSFASRGFALLPFRSRLAVVVASLLYREIGRRLQIEQTANPLLGRVKVSFARKLGLACEALLRVLLFRHRFGKGALADCSPESFLQLLLS